MLKNGLRFFKSMAVLPSSLKGCKKLNKADFDTLITVPCISTDAANLMRVMPVLKRYDCLLSRPHVKHVVTDETESTKKRILLEPSKFTNSTKDDIQTEISNSGTKVDYGSSQLKLSFDNFSHNDCIKAILPDGLPMVTGFTQIGHIVHLNLDPELDEYKYVIGEQ